MLHGDFALMGNKVQLFQNQHFTIQHRNDRACGSDG
ncbi:hypothetical protein B398_10170 [Xylella fastidiosa 32]|nr:hypothetical protein B398_10170 [Xylella fastidiosa 32]